MAYTTINKPSQYFDTQLWTGDNGNGRTFTGLGFQPNLIWSKCRDSSNYNHVWVDRVRGGNYFLFSNSTAAEDNKSHGEITSWNSDGSTWANGTNATYPRAYYNDGAGSTLGGSTYVSWNWKAGDSAGSSNTQGSITSTVSVNTTSGFSIVSWTGAGSAGTVGHGLGAVPKFIITKKRNNTGNWGCYHVSLGNTKYIYLNTTGASATYSGYWNDTTPTSTLISLGTDDNVTGNGDNIIAYCFAEIKGFSKFGSYTGNGSTDGTFVYTGFKPAWVLMKVTSTTDSWLLMDNKRDTYNQVINQLEPNASNAASDNTARAMDFLSNGFKFRSNNTQNNASGATYIYAAFAENPFVSSTLIPTTAR
jgi:hypothetical protein